LQGFKGFERFEGFKRFKRFWFSGLRIFSIQV